MRDWLGPANASKAPPARRASGASSGRAASRDTARSSAPSRPPSGPPDGLRGGDLGRAELAAIQRLAGNGAAATLVRRAADADPGRPALQREPDASSEAVYEEAEAEAGNDRLVQEAGAVVDAAGGPLSYRALPADLEGEGMFVIFDDLLVQRLFRYLLAHWGLAGDAMENSPGGGASSPPWVGEFRAKALNVRPQAAAGEGAAADEARLGRLAGRLADSVAAETPAQRIRRLAVQEIQQRIGTTVMTQDAINAERGKAATDGLTPANFTTCIAFFGQVMGQVMAKSDLKAPIIKGPNAYREINSRATESLGSRWKPYVPGARPKPGDLLIFTFNEDEKNPDGSVKYGEGWFAHISILRAIEPMEADTGGPAERWISVDGGGTTAKETFRVFHPDTGLIVGPGTITRTMKGWIDIEAAVEAGLVPKP